jgi:ABC-type multidrug transport system ATPase subunit
LLEGVELVVASGQFMGLLGPSGGGKTTLLKCLAGYLPPVDGQVTHDGTDLQALREAGLADVGFVPQDDVVYGRLTVRENLDFALRLRVATDLEAAERSEVVIGALERVRLREQADRLVAVLSGGQRKRLNVALELLTRPRLLFLDEPTSGLDPAAEGRLMHLLKELSRRGVTVVCATHVLAHVELFDRVAVVAEGTVPCCTVPSEVPGRFGVSNYPALYEELERRQPGRPKGESPATVVPALAPQTLPSGAQPGAPTTTRSIFDPVVGLLRQVAVQVQRGLRQVLRDRALLVLLLGQPVLIGLLINLAQLRPTGLSSIFLFVVVTALWLGLNNTAREVVRERAIYIRERLAGVTPLGYLLAKVVLYGAIGVVQLVLLLLVVRYLNLLSSGDASDLRAWPLGYVLAVVWGAYLSSLLLGSLVSTIAETQEAAVAALPLIILPQLLLTGVVTGLDSARDGSFRSLVLLVGKAAESSRGLTGWIVELLSLLTYSRPALALLQEVRGDQTAVSPTVVRLVDVLHLLVLLLATATGLVATFRWRERRWLERG